MTITITIGIPDARIADRRDSALEEGLKYFEATRGPAYTPHHDTWTPFDQE